MKSVFVSEFLCGGGWPDAEFPASLVQEGRLMLQAAIDDLLQNPDVEVSLTWDRRLDSPPQHPRVKATVCTQDQEPELFAQLASQAEATLVIAPESEQILLHRMKQLEQWQKPCLGCGSGSQFAHDKWQTAKELIRQQIPTIPTVLFKDWYAEMEPVKSTTNQWVVKSRWGCGGEELKRCTTDELAQMAETMVEQQEELVVQPWREGMPCSIGVLSHPQGVLRFPLTRQNILWENGFQYTGGTILPRYESPELQTTLDALAIAITKQPGMNGYFGVDFLLDEQQQDLISVVEINPRLTSSFVGYRELLSKQCEQSLSLLLEADIKKLQSAIKTLWSCEDFTFCVE